MIGFFIDLFLLYIAAVVTAIYIGIILKILNGKVWWLARYRSSYELNIYDGGYIYITCGDIHLNHSADFGVIYRRSSGHQDYGVDYSGDYDDSGRGESCDSHWGDDAGNSDSSSSSSSDDSGSSSDSDSSSSSSCSDD